MIKQRSDWRTWVNRAETNQHKDLARSVEMSGIISQTLSMLDTGLLMWGKSMCYKLQEEQQQTWSFLQRILLSCWGEKM